MEGGIKDMKKRKKANTEKLTFKKNCPCISVSFYRKTRETHTPTHTHSF